MVLAIEARSIDREKSVHVNQFTLRFREAEKERLYHQDFDLGFTCSILCSFFLLILSAGLQVSCIVMLLVVYMQLASLFGNITKQPGFSTYENISIECQKTLNSVYRFKVSI